MFSTCLTWLPVHSRSKKLQRMLRMIANSMRSARSWARKASKARLLECAVPEVAVARHTLHGPHSPAHPVTPALWDYPIELAPQTGTIHFPHIVYQHSCNNEFLLPSMFICINDLYQCLFYCTIRTRFYCRLCCGIIYQYPHCITVFINTNYRSTPRHMYTCNMCHHLFCFRIWLAQLQHNDIH